MKRRNNSRLTKHLIIFVLILYLAFLLFLVLYLHSDQCQQLFKSSSPPSLDNEARSLGAHYFAGLPFSSTSARAINFYINLICNGRGSLPIYNSARFFRRGYYDSAEASVPQNDFSQLSAYPHPPGAAPRQFHLSFEDLEELRSLSDYSTNLKRYMMQAIYQEWLASSPGNRYSRLELRGHRTNGNGLSSDETGIKVGGSEKDVTSSLLGLIPKSASELAQEKWFGPHTAGQRSADITSFKKSSPTIPFLIDLSDFEYVISNDICRTKDVYMIIMVHTAPKHFRERLAIRSTWGKPGIFRHILTRVAFLLGKVSGADNKTDPIHIQNLIEEENQIYGDIIQGNFVDAYRNLTYKNLMGKKWVSECCGQARYVLKTDDDMFVDMFQLIQFLEDEYASPVSNHMTHDSPPSDLLMCFLFPASPAVSDSNDKNAKWLVDKSEFEGDMYPPYCSGRAYVLTPKLAHRLYAASIGDRYFWIDDVYVTGILAHRLGVNHVEVNDLFNLYDSIKSLEWLANGAPEPLKFIFTYSEDGFITFYKLWNKTVNQHERIRLNYQRDLTTRLLQRRHHVKAIAQNYDY